MLRKSAEPKILIVEDNDDDFETTVRALQNSGISKDRISRCVDGMDGWMYLNGEGKYATASDLELPSLVLLDLNMPGLDGHGLLSKLKTSEKLSSMPVVVMTTSSDLRDINACYKAGGNCYVTKPVSWIEFSETVDALAQYWFSIAELPETLAESA